MSVKFKHNLLILFVCCFTFSVGELMGAEELVLKIAIQASGNVHLDGNPVNPDELANALEKAKQNNGVVWYYRENPEAEPPSSANQVLQMIIANRLPISMSTKPDFSDYVDQDGIVHPRK